MNPDIKKIWDETEEKTKSRKNLEINNNSLNTQFKKYEVLPSSIRESKSEPKASTATQPQHLGQRPLGPSCDINILKTILLQQNTLIQQSVLINGMHPTQIVVREAILRNNYLLLEQQKQALVEKLKSNVSSYFWNNTIPLSNHENITYSRKIFLGGAPRDITEVKLLNIFKNFGNIIIQWPHDEATSQTHMTGYAYIIFESEAIVKQVLKASEIVSDTTEKRYFFSYFNSKKRDVFEIIPWIVEDCYFHKSPMKNNINTSTVYVGGLHGKTTAIALAKIMDDLFSGVICTTIDYDKWYYPTGSARVTFDNPYSYMLAVAARFVQIDHVKIKKKIQIDPFLEVSLCSLCKRYEGPYFCRELLCFRYFCLQCWTKYHAGINYSQDHKPITRYSAKKENSKQHLEKPKKFQQNL